MEPKITVKEDYILVEPEERDYLEIFVSLGKLYTMPEYLNKDVIWIFREGPIKVTYDDLYKLGDFAQKHFPEKTSITEKRIAIVVETGLHEAMAKEYAKIVRDRGPEISVFYDVGSAEEWIVEN